MRASSPRREDGRSQACARVHHSEHETNGRVFFLNRDRSRTTDQIGTWHTMARMLRQSHPALETLRHRVGGQSLPVCVGIVAPIPSIALGGTTDRRRKTVCMCVCQVSNYPSQALCPTFAALVVPSLSHLVRCAVWQSAPWLRICGRQPWPLTATTATSQRMGGAEDRESAFARRMGRRLRFSIACASLREFRVSRPSQRSEAWSGTRFFAFLGGSIVLLPS